VSGWLTFGLGLATIPVAIVLYGVAYETWRGIRRAARRRRKGPANDLAYGLVSAIGEKKRRVSARLLHSWRLPGNRRYELILLKEGPREPTERFFWPREPEPLDDPPSPDSNKEAADG